MTRVLAILLLAFSGLTGFGVETAAGQHGDCGHAACVAPPVETTCCGSTAPADTFCPMSGGACTCVVSPDRRPVPEHPLPRSDRESPTAAPAPPARVQKLIEPEIEPFRGSGVSTNLLAGLTHNEIQALLGIWRI